MHTLFIVLLIIDCIALITVVLLKKVKVIMDFQVLFGKQKQRGVDLFLHRLTIILAVIFF